MLPFLANENLKGRGRYLLGEKQVDSSELVLQLAGRERRRPGLVFPPGTSGKEEVVKPPGRRGDAGLLECTESSSATGTAPAGRRAGGLEVGLLPAGE